MIIILLLFMVLGFAVQARLKNRFKKYSESYLTSGLSGAEVARRMLDFYGLHSVQIISVPGKLSDHYNPANKTVNLSPEVYEGRNVSAAAVAAHECGHAVQHATAYTWLTMRSKMVPVVNMSGQIMNMVFLFSIFGMSILGLGWDQALIVLIVAQTVLATFAVVTLPVEYDLVAVQTGDYHFVETSDAAMWANPRISHLAKRMQEAVARQDSRKSLAARVHFAQSVFAPERTALLMRNRLAQLVPQLQAQ